jgi:hypothetical protein
MPQFANPIAPKINKKNTKNIWDFRAPPYDERSSCYMDAGTHYGVGYTNPVGHDGPVKQRVATMPFGHKLGLETDETPRRQLNPELDE